MSDLFEIIPDYAQRRIIYGGEVTTPFGVEFTNHFMAIDQSQGPITLVCSSSSGGDWSFAGLGLLDLILSSTNKIIAYGLGCQASTQAMLFLAADERYLSPRANLLFHYGSIEISDTYQNTIDYSEILKKEMQADIAYLESRSNKPAKFWQDKLNKQDFYLSAELALEYELIQGISTPN